jgi:hypothetical protein
MPTIVTDLHAQKTPLQSRFAAIVNNSDFIATDAVLLVISLVVAALAMLRFPNAGAIIAEYNQF